MIESLKELEKKLVLEALERHGGNKTRAAAELGVSRWTIIRLLRKIKKEGQR